MSTFKNLRSRGRLSEADIDATIREIRRALLDADVAVPVVRAFTGAVRERSLSAEVSGALNPAQQVVKIVNEELVAILGGANRPLHLAKTPPTVIMLAGLQGAGKTTPAGNQGSDDALVASADPVGVAREGLATARARQHDVLIVDTAGRLGLDAELMTQASDIRDAIAPDEILFVIDAMIGQDAVTTAQAFADGVGFTGVVLTKLDGDARGGAAQSVASVTVELRQHDTGEAD